MAKKPVSKAKPTRAKASQAKPAKPERAKSGAASLTAAQIQSLAKSLMGTRGNVYRMCEAMFNITVQDDIFERLGNEADLFRCEQCNEWMSKKEERDPDMGESDYCKECVDEMNATLSDDEDAEADEAASDEED